VLAFVHIEKTAGTSTSRILQRSFGSGGYCVLDRWRESDQSFTAADYRKLRWFYPRLRGMGGHWIKPYMDLREAIPGIRYFTFLREPLARTASHYQHQIQRMNRSASLEEWLRLELYRNFQIRKLVGCDDVGTAQALLEKEFVLVGLTERYDESMVMLRKKLGPDVIDIRYQAENVASDSALREGLLSNSATRALLEEANRADIALYNWVREELYPRQQRDYGPTLGRDVSEFRATNRVEGPDWRALRAEIRRRYVYRPAVRLHQRLSRWIHGPTADPGIVS
jgi:Sulfotransferase family